MTTSTIDAAAQMALDVISLAIRGGMPDTLWQSDSRIARACAVLAITPEQARDLSADVYLTGLPERPQTIATAADFDDFDDLAAFDTGTTPEPSTARLEVWTDGGCDPNPGPGGFGWITNEAEPRQGCGGDPATTNNRMEIQAVIDALTTIPERPIVVHSDSKYVVDTLQKKWYVGWSKRGWKNAKGEPVKNRDLWEILVPLAVAPGITFQWVKGHAGTPLNEAADQLATAGILIGKKAMRQ